MSLNFQNELDAIIKDNYKYRFSTELENTHDNDRKSKISCILDQYETKTEQQIVDEKKRKMFEEVDKQAFKQNWGKLSEYHKEAKIKEYIDNKYSDYEKKNILLDNLLTILRSSRTAIDKYILYDNMDVNPKIIEIKGIVEDNISTKKISSSSEKITNSKITLPKKSNKKIVQSSTKKK